MLMINIKSKANRLCACLMEYHPGTIHTSYWDTKLRNFGNKKPIYI